MSEPMTAPASGEAMLTLTEVSKRLGISMPTLQRYKKGYQDRIPSEGSGRQQRYPESALAVFEAIREESEGRRGRPRKTAAGAAKPPAKERKKAAGKGAKRSAKSAVKSAASAPEAAAKGVEAKGRKVRGKASVSGKAVKAGRAAASGAAAKAVAKRGKGKKLANAAGAAAATVVKPAPRGKPAKSAKGGKAVKGNKAAKATKPEAAAKSGKGAAAGKLLTLAAIGDLTGISGPTLQRYIKRFTDQIPVVGSGRAKRYPQAAIEVFNRLRNESKRGPKAGLKKLAGTAAKAARTVVGQVEGGVAKRLAAIEKLAAGLQKQLDAIRKEIGKPIKVTINRG